jgi:hypothetical protein
VSGCSTLAESKPSAANPKPSATSAVRVPAAKAAANPTPRSEPHGTSAPHVPPVKAAAHPITAAKSPQLEVVAPVSGCATLAESKPSAANPKPSATSAVRVPAAKAAALPTPVAYLASPVKNLLLLGKPTTSATQSVEKAQMEMHTLAQVDLQSICVSLGKVFANAIKRLNNGKALAAGGVYYGNKRYMHARANASPTRSRTTTATDTHPHHHSPPGTCQPRWTWGGSRPGPTKCSWSPPAGFSRR